MIEGLYDYIISSYVGNEQIKSIQSVAGGCINNTSRIATNKGVYFVKVNSSANTYLFEKEEKGLNLLKQVSPLKTPSVLGRGEFHNNTYLLLEWVDKGIASVNFWKKFGQLLAEQHKITKSEFGLDHDNHIGRLNQSNQRHIDWYDFFIKERLLPQINLANDNHLLDANTLNQFDSFFQRLKDLIPLENPALLHGDLWSGNFLCGHPEEPYLVDPAIHFGHRETEIAFTTMFGGFKQEFYDSYNDIFPLEPGFESRIEIHNLYPLLVHLNLFGTSYLGGIKSTLKKFS